MEELQLAIQELEEQQKQLQEQLDKHLEWQLYEEAEWILASLQVVSGELAQLKQIDNPMLKDITRLERSMEGYKTRFADKPSIIEKFLTRDEAELKFMKKTACSVKPNTTFILECIEKLVTKQLNSFTIGLINAHMYFRFYSSDNRICFKVTSATKGRNLNWNLNIASLSAIGRLVPYNDTAAEVVGPFINTENVELFFNKLAILFMGRIWYHRNRAAIVYY